MTLGVSQNRLNAVQRHLELVGDFGFAYAVVEVVDDGIHGHARATQHGSAALPRGLTSTKGDCDQSICSLAGISTSRIL